MDRIENLTAQHDVIAQSINSIIWNLSKDNQQENAKEIVKHNIVQAYIYNMSQAAMNTKDPKAKENLRNLVDEVQFFKEIQKMELDKKSLRELLIIMYSFQAKAGIKPIQVYNRKANVFDEMGSKLGE